LDRRGFLATALTGIAGAAERAHSFTTDRRPGRVDLFVDRRLVSGLVFDERWDKPFIYPLRTLSGIALERGFPLAQRKDESTDHPWHRGLIYGHGVINGVDFWRELGRGQSGRLIPRGEPEESGSNLKLRLAMQPPTGAAIGTIEQFYTLRVIESCLVIEATITVAADAGAALQFGDTEDGGFGMRLRDEFRQDRGAILRNSEGLQGTENIWGKPARWVDYTAEIEGRLAGVALYDHPGNPRHPSRWHARGYGLCCANPFALRDFTGDASADGSFEIPAGDELVLRYRAAIHEGAGFDPESIRW